MTSLRLSASILPALRLFLAIDQSKNIHFLSSVLFIEEFHKNYDHGK